MKGKALTVWFWFLAVVFPGVLLAQDAPLTADEPAYWLKYVAMAITGVLVPVAVELLKKYWPSAPALAKSLMALVGGSLILAAQTFLSEALGYPIDLSAIAAIITGGALGLAGTVGFAVGKKS